MGMTKDAVLARDVAVLVETFRRGLGGNLVGLVLTGGHGRGEGAWIRTEAGSWRAYNDYDLVALTRGPVLRGRLASVSSRAQQRLTVRWVDAYAYPTVTLPYRAPTLFNFDLRYGSRAVSGSDSLIARLPVYRPEQISPYEVLVLHTTRLWAVVGGVSGEVLGAGATGERARFCRYQLAKAVLAAVDALLIPEGAYRSSYAVRTAAAGGFLRSEQDRQLVQWAMDQKLEPSSEDWPAASLRERFLVVSEFFSRCFASVIGTQFGRDVRSNVAIVRLWDEVRRRRLRSRVADAARRRRSARRLTEYLVQASLVDEALSAGFRPDASFSAAPTLLDPVGLEPDGRVTWDAARRWATKSR